MQHSLRLIVPATAFALALIVSAAHSLAQDAPHHEHHHHVDVPMNDGPLVANPGMGDRGYKHGEFHHQYMKWHNQNGTHCCNSYDCRMTVARWEGGHWKALVDGVWKVMDADRHVLDDYGVGPFATVCASRTGHVWCFDRPDVGA